MRSRALTAGRPNRLCQKGRHEMHNKTPRPHGFVTSQRATGSEELFQGASNPPDINNQDYEQVPIDQRIKEIQELVKKGDKAKDKAEQYYATAGLHLKSLREDSPSKAAWENLIKSKCGLGTSRAYELIQIADNRKTVTEVRSVKAERMRKLRSRPPRGVQNQPGIAEPEESGEPYPRARTTTPANQEQLNRLAYRLIQNDLETARELYEVLCNDPLIRHLVRALAHALQAEEKHKLNDGGGMPSASVVPDDGLDIPEYLRRT
jgi:hypothetical protein